MSDADLASNTVQAVLDVGELELDVVEVVGVVDVVDVVEVVEVVDVVDVVEIVDLVAEGLMLPKYKSNTKIQYIKNICDCTTFKGRTFR